MSFDEVEGHPCWGHASSAGWSDQPPEGISNEDGLELVLAEYSKHWGNRPVA